MTALPKKSKAEPLAALVQTLTQKRQLALEYEAHAHDEWLAFNAIETQIRAQVPTGALVVDGEAGPTVILIGQTDEHPSISFHAAQMITGSATVPGKASTAKKSSAVPEDKKMEPESHAGEANADDVVERRQDELIVEARSLATRAAKTVGREKTVALIQRVGKAKKLGEVAAEHLPELIAALTASMSEQGGEL